MANRIKTEYSLPVGGKPLTLPQLHFRLALIAK